MTTYTLIIAEPNADGRVSGPWVQDCCRGLVEAMQRCRATSELNSGQTYAVVEQFGGPCALLDGARCENVVPFCVAGRDLAGFVLPVDQRIYDAGRAAFLRSAVRTPALDPAVAPLLAERGDLLNRMGVRGSPRARALAGLLGFWLAGFDAALHAEPVKA